MKKVWVFLAVTLMLCALTACVDTPTKETYQGGSSLEQSQTKSESFGLNETAVFEKLKITATEIKTSKGDEFFTPEEGKVFVGVKFTVENISSEEQTVSSLMMFEGYVDDVKCDYSFSASCAFDEGTLDGDILPGKKMVGWYALEVPENWASIELAVKSDLFSDSAAFKFTK